MRRYTWGLACILVASMWPGVGAAQTADTLFDSTTLQRIDLWVNSRDWAELQATFEANTRYPANLVWRGLTVRNVSVRSRGSGTRDPIRPGLLLEFGRYVKGQRFLGLKQLVLDNLRQDPSGIHEMLAMDLHRKMGLPASREAPAALYVNGRLLGTYAVVEPVDDVMVGRVFGEGDGYLFEYRWNDVYNATYLGPEFGPYRRILEPRTHDTAPDEELYAPIEAAFRAINDSSDDEFVETVSPYLDLEGVMKYLAVQSFVAESDGLVGLAGMNNFYLYRPRGGRLQLIPWDEDNAFYAADYPIDGGTTPINVLVRRALQAPGLRQVFFDALLELARLSEEGASENSPGWLGQEVGRLKDVTAELTRSAPLRQFTDEEFEQAMADLADFARTRPAFVRQEIDRVKASGLLDDILK